MKNLSLALITNIISDILGKFVPLIMLSLAQKRLGLMGFGTSQMGLSIIEFCVPLVAFGYNQYGSLHLSKLEKRSHAEGAFVSDIFCLKSIHYLLVVLCLLIMQPFLFKNFNEPKMLLGLCLLLFLSVIDLLWFQVARQKMTSYSFLTLFGKIFSLVCVFFLVKDEKDAPLFAWLLFGTSCFVCLLTFLYCYKDFYFVKPSFKRMKKIFITSSGFSLIVIYTVIMDRWDIFVIEHLLGLNACGLYSGVSRISGTISQTLAVGSLVFFSETLKNTSKEKIQQKAEESLLFFSALLTPIILGSLVTDQDMLSFIYDDTFRQTKGVLPLLLAGNMGTVFLLVFAQQVLQIHHETKPVLFAMIIGFLIFIGIVMSPFFEATFTTVALSQMIGKLATGFILVYFAKKHLVRIPFKPVLLPLIPGSLMMLFLVFAPIEHFILKIIAGGFIYAICGLALWRLK